MALPSGSIYEIRWNELCPWLVLAKTLRASLLVRVLVYAWLGLLLTHWGWQACESMWFKSAGRSELAAESTNVRNPRATNRRLLAGSLVPDDSLGTVVSSRPRNYLEPQPLRWVRNHWRVHGFGPLVEGWRRLNLPFIQIFQLESTRGDTLRFLICGLWAVVVWAFFGSAIARTTARYCTDGETITPVAAARAAITKWPSTAGAPVIALVFVALLAIPLALTGLLSRVDLLALVAGLLWILLLAGGFVLAVVLIALWIGWPLMWATIAVERSDAFDAASRTAAYVYQRPLRFAFYVFVATALGIFGQIVVSGFASATTHLTEWAASWGSGSERIAELAIPADVSAEALSGSAALAAQAIGFWKRMLVTLAAAYPLAYLFSASVGIYLLLRLHVDSTEMDEIVGDRDELLLPTQSRVDADQAGEGI